MVVKSEVLRLFIKPDGYVWWPRPSSQQAKLEQEQFRTVVITKNASDSTVITIALLIIVGAIAGDDWKFVA